MLTTTHQEGSCNMTQYLDALNFFHIFRGSRDTITPMYAGFEPPFQASQVRVIPFSRHPRVVCLRLELHGCTDTSKIILQHESFTEL